MSDNDNNSKLYKRVSANAKSTIRLKKIFSFLFVAYAIVLLMIYTKHKYEEKTKDVATKIGAGIETNITVEKTLQIKKLTIDRYKKYMLAGEYDSAYNMLTDEYKYYCDFDTFVANASTIDWSTVDVEDINAKNDYCYVATVVHRNDDQIIKTKYLLYLNRYLTDVFTISPDNFVYSYKNQDFEKSGVSLHIDECVITINDVTLVGSIKNTSWFSDISIKAVNAAYGNSLVARGELEHVLKKDEEIPFSLVYSENTEFFIPDNVKIETEKGDKTVSYSFYFKENQ